MDSRQTEDKMVIVIVHVKVKEKYIKEFINATTANAESSLREPGVQRFDFLQQEDSPQSFIINEVYKDEAAPAAHKLTTHYKKWRDEVAYMMDEPRYSIKFKNIFPKDEI